MAESSEEWELSKENIRPIQQGRKQDVLKMALAPHPEDVVAQQRQSFENELRTYSGNDPLAIWCKYIKWVEQNYPKGGREGHIKQLLEHCLSILKDEKKYFDDDRFVDIMLKYANLSGRPIEVYNYMYSNKIGCKSAKFFINWSWELEQLNNLKRADEILTEGIKHRAKPNEKMQSYRTDFEIRFANKIKANSGNNNIEIESSRSAFAVLKPHKKNLAPTMRTGDAVIENKSSLVLGRQQPQPRSTTSFGKVPFKIYNSENINPSLPVQSQSVPHGSFNLENYKENEQKPIKWNKFKVKSRSSKLPSEANPDFKFHCDDENDQEIQTPRSVPKTSNILNTHRRTPSPPIALFEPPDPLKRPMYPKNKVYAGAVEYSLEEIRAAEWQEKQKKIEKQIFFEKQQIKIEKQAKNEEQLKKEVEYLTKQVNLLKSQFTASATSNASEKCDETNSLKNEADSNGLNIPPNDKIEPLMQAQNSKLPIHIKSNPQNTSHTQLISSEKVLSLKKTPESFEKKSVVSASYTTDKMLQELYNRTFSHATDEDSKKIDSNKMNQIILPSVAPNDKLPFKFYHDFTEEIIDSKKMISSKDCMNENSLPTVTATEQIGDAQSITSNSDKLPFTFYQDPTENMSNSIEGKQVEEKLSISKTPSDKLAFSFYQDPTENMSNSNERKQVEEKLSISKTPSDKFSFYHDPSATIPISSETVSSKSILTKEIPEELPHEASSEENAENIPPEEYIQKTTKRELAGILEPSKNILFIPLEQQELDDESDIEDDYIFQDGQQHKDDTLIPPSNTEQFSTAKFLASTPYIARHNSCSNLEEPNHEIKSSENLNPIKQIFASDENAVSKIELNPSKEPGLNSELKSACYSRLPNILSVIMETSSENYSKSSSSSSSASLTKSNHLEQYSAQHLSLHKTSSKLETYESSTINSVSGVSEHKNNNEENKITQLYSVDFDPFDEKNIQKLLKSINISNYKNICHVDKCIRAVKPGESLCITDSMYMIENLIAEGAYAKVYKAVEPFITHGGYSNRKLAIKVCKKGNEWEFYICCEVKRRLSELKFLANITNSVMNAITAIKYSDGIVIVDEYSELGTLLDVVNFYKKQNAAIPELLVMYFTLEILHIVSGLHKCNIIHGDVKADNFLLLNFNFDVDVLEKISQTTFLKLIDFGRAIDLNLYDKGVCFTTIFSSKDLQCNEMKDKKPWVFQLDWYGVLSCIHTLLFLEYMTVKKNNGVWEIEKKFKRYWFTSLWEPLFNKLLNIPECYEEPDISSFIDMIESKLQQNASIFINQLTRFSSVYSRRT